MVVKVKPGKKEKTRNRVKVKDLAKSRHELTAQDMKRVKGGARATSSSLGIGDPATVTVSVDGNGDITTTDGANNSIT